MSIKELIEISKWDNFDNLTREDILELANLPDDFELRDLPEFPSPDEAEKMCFPPCNLYRTTTWFYEGDMFSELHHIVDSYPKLVQQAILQACKNPVGFRRERYNEIVLDIKNKHKKISAVLGNSKS